MCFISILRTTRYLSIEYNCVSQLHVSKCRVKWLFQNIKQLQVCVQVHTHTAHRQYPERIDPSLNGPCISSPRTIDWHIAMNEYRHNRPLCFHLHHNCQDLDRNH